MFRKILIANRGEIACRIIRTAQNMGILTTAVYSAADKDSLHVKEADEAFYLGLAPALDSYLNVDALLQIALRANADALHPGYGFLSENAALASACKAAGIVFIGPSVHALNIMGSKRLAKQHLSNSQVPLIPGYHGEDQSDARLLAEAVHIGFPLLIKPSLGGGGKGMHEVQEPEALTAALAGARREALSSFGNDHMLLEKCIAEPRHIEVQIMADNFGQIVHIFERDCSVQRRHQKVIEEAPASHLAESLRQQLRDTAIAVAKAIDYRGAGTVEFLVDKDGQFYFMEMNTRLQVEHAVTEMITGLDLVAWQIHIAANHPLPLQQADIHAEGHAIECRVYAEDPAHAYLPTSGTISHLRFPEADYLRIDTALEIHTVISPYYDPMLAKIIVRGSDRDQAIQRLASALRHTEIGGIPTNLTLLSTILRQAHFVDNSFTTALLREPLHHAVAPDSTDAIITAVTIGYRSLVAQETDPLYRASFAWQAFIPRSWQWRYQCQEQTFLVTITARSQEQFDIQLPDNTIRTITILRANHEKISYDDGQHIYHYSYEKIDYLLRIYTPAGVIAVHHLVDDRNSALAVPDASLTAPMPGHIVAILKKIGDEVTSGEALLVLEAMKMEHTIRAPHAGVVQEMCYPIGANVPEGALLVRLESL